MTACADEIARYIGHLEDRVWIAALVDRFGVSEVLASVCKLVAGGDPDAAQNALTLVRDLGIFGMVVDRKLTQSFREQMPSRLFPALAGGLRVRSYAVRSSVVYTIGKLSFEDQSPLLRDAFDMYVDRDPLLLPRIVSELFWLSGPEWSYVDRLASSSNHLIRWSAVGALEPHPSTPGDETFGPKRATYRRLANDPFDLVREETRYLLWSLEGAPSDPGGDPPGLTFGRIELGFTNQLAYGADYTLAELDAFVAASRR